jgi:hypothetical protein
MNRQMMALALAVLVGAAVITEAQPNKACGLVTTGELEGLLGGKVSGLNSDAATFQTGKGNLDVQMCRGRTPKASILLRIAKGGGDSKDAAAKGIEMYKKWEGRLT